MAVHSSTAYPNSPPPSPSQRVFGGPPPATSPNLVDMQNLFGDAFERRVSGASKPRSRSVSTTSSVGVATDTKAASAAKKSSFGRKVKHYVGLLRTDKAYRKGVIGMWTNQLGDGLVSGSFLLLLTMLGTASQSLPIVGLAVFTLIEIGIAAATHVHGAHKRDNAENQARNNPTPEERAAQRRKDGRKLIISGVVDAGVACLGAVGLVGGMAFGLGPLPLLGIICACKGIQAFNKMYETNAWGSLRYNISESKEVQKKQLDMRSTIAAIELGIGAMVFGITSLVVLQGLLAAGSVFPPLWLLALALGLMGAGGVLTAAPKLWVGLKAVYGKSA